MDSAKGSFYGGNLQRLSSKIEVNQTPAVNFDQFVIQTTKRSVEVESNYAFKSKGKYTTQFNSNVTRKTDRAEHPSGLMTPKTTFAEFTTDSMTSSLPNRSGNFQNTRRFAATAKATITSSARHLESPTKKAAF